MECLKTKARRITKKDNIGQAPTITKGLLLDTCNAFRNRNTC